jgi:hypothetical protein
MKKALSAFLQFVLFLLVFAVGSFLRPLHLQWDLAVAAGSIIHRTFVPDGLFLMLALFVVILLVQLIMKRLRTSAPITTLALILATVVGLAMKLGFITRDLY